MMIKVKTKSHSKEGENLNTEIDNAEISTMFEDYSRGISEADRKREISPLGKALKEADRYLRYSFDLAREIPTIAQLKCKTLNLSIDDIMTHCVTQAKEALEDLGLSPREQHTILNHIVVSIHFRESYFSLKVTKD